MSNQQMDVLYLQGKEAVNPFEFYYTNLRPFLVKYARHICKSTLRQVDDHLVTEMVDDLLIEIGRFRGLSRFSTWAHARFHYRCIAEHRYKDRNLGSSLEALIDPIYVGAERALIEEFLTLEEIRDGLSGEQQAVLRGRLEGYTFDEIGEKLGIDRNAAFRVWQTVLLVA